MLSNNTSVYKISQRIIKALASNSSSGQHKLDNKDITRINSYKKNKHKCKMESIISMSNSSVMHRKDCMSKPSFVNSRNARLL